MGWIWPTVCSIYLLFYTQQKEFSFLTTLLPFSNLNTTFLFSFLSLFFTPLKKLMYSSNKIINKQSAVTVRPFYGRKTIMKIKSLTKVYFNFRMRRRKNQRHRQQTVKETPKKQPSMIRQIPALPIGIITEPVVTTSTCCLGSGSDCCSELNTLQNTACCSVLLLSLWNNKTLTRMKS